MEESYLCIRVIGEVVDVIWVTRSELDAELTPAGYLRRVDFVTCEVENLHYVVHSRDQKSFDRTYRCTEPNYHIHAVGYNLKKYCKWSNTNKKGRRYTEVIIVKANKQEEYVTMSLNDYAINATKQYHSSELKELIKSFTDEYAPGKK